MTITFGIKLQFTRYLLAHLTHYTVFLVSPFFYNDGFQKREINRILVPVIPSLMRGNQNVPKIRLYMKWGTERDLKA